MTRIFSISMLLLSVCFPNYSSYGASTVTASKGYVDRKTKVNSVTNVEVGVVGYTIGVNSNEVLASTNYVDKKVSDSVPGDYYTVSNAAMRAYSDLVAFATTGSVHRITDGTNAIDAAGNVYIVGCTNTVWIWRGSTDYGQPIWKKADDDDIYFWWLESEWLEPTSEFPNGQNATNLVFEIDDVFVSCYRETFTFTNYVGKIALTNDIPPAVTVVAPSTNAVSGQAADAKATGTALYTGFTEWEISGIPEVVKSEYDLMYLSWSDMDEGWSLNFKKDLISWGESTAGSIDDTYLVFTNVYDDKSGVTFTATATRHLITPTKTSQLVNDGSNGVPFAVVSQIPAPVDISGKLDSTAVSGDWSEAPPSIYQEGDVVTYNGSIWRHRSTSTNADPPSSSNADWQQLFIEGWKQDRLTFDNAPTQDSDNPVKSGGVYAALDGKVSTNALAGRTYDFSRNYYIIRATADLVQLLGGTVTNNPTAQGGN